MMKKYKMLKKSLLLVAATGLIGLIFCAVYIQNDTSLDSLREVAAKTTSRKLPEQIKIGVIGDSWVAGQKLDRAIEQAVAASGFKTTVLSSGHPGAKSRQIYRDLLNENQSDPYSSNKILMDEDVDFFVVVAGVNDTAGHIGKEFYAHHMVLIIQVAVDRGMFPVVVEVPEYGIEEAPAVGFLSWAKREIYLRLFDNGKVDVISDYRKALRDSIPATILEKVTFVEFAEIAQDYDSKKTLYANPSHLNKDGYERLGRLIAKRIQESHNNAMHSDGNSAALHSRR